MTERSEGMTVERPPGSRTSMGSGGASPRRAGNTVVGWYRPLVRARTWKESTALLLGLPFGIAWFTILVTGLSVSAGLLITLVGIPLLVLTVAFGRVIGIVE